MVRPSPFRRASAPADYGRNKRSSLQPLRVIPELPTPITPPRELRPRQSSLPGSSCGTECPKVTAYVSFVLFFRNLTERIKRIVYVALDS